MRKIASGTVWRILLTAFLLGMAVCIYVLISQTSGIDRVYLIREGVVADEPLELLPGETWEQGFYAYKAFDHVVLHRANAGAESILAVEVIRDDQLLFSEEISYALNETEKDIPVPAGDWGTFVVRLTNLGDTSILLPLLSLDKYRIGEWDGGVETQLQLEVYRTSHSAMWCYLLSALILGVFSLAALWGWGKKWSPGKAALLVLTFCLVYVLLFPAWNINDFGKHFATAYAFTNRLLGIEAEEPGDLMIREDDQRFFEDVLSDWYQTPYQPTLRSYDDAVGFLFQHTENNALIPMEGITSVHREHGIWSYLPFIPGILIARLLSLNLVTVIFFARLCGVGCYTVGIYLALRKMPKGLLVPATVLSCVPVCLMNLTAISYDAPCYVAILYLFASIFRLREKYRTQDAIGLVICSLVLCLVKRGAYAPVLLSLLLLLQGRDKRKIRLVALCAFAGGLGLAIIYRGLIFGGGNVQALQSEGMGTYNIKWALNHPLDYFLMMIRTFLRQPDMAFSAIGKYLGWNRAAIPDGVCGLFYLLIGLAVFASEQEGTAIRPLSRFEQGWAWGAIAIMILILPASILNFTPLARDTVEGLQGRYFLPLLIPLLMLCFHHPRGKVSLKNCDSAILLWGTGFLHMLSVYYIWLTFLHG